MKIRIRTIDVMCALSVGLFMLGTLMSFAQEESKDVVPFISPYETYFASDDDPFPGEDVIFYCEAMTGEYTKIKNIKSQGKLKEQLQMETVVGAIEAGAYKVEVQRAIDQIEAAYASNEVWDLPSWVAYGQDCVNRRLTGTWYSYDWKNDSVYPIKFRR